jgi:HEAT repeat protein
MALGENEELSVCAINVLGAMGLEKSLKAFVKLLSEQKLPSNISDVLTEALCLHADLIREDVIKVYNPIGIGADSFEEVFSNMGKDERVFKFLYAAFLNNKSNLAINAAYLAKYGDDRALPILYSTIKRNDISILEYSEIKNAIEKLGGEVEDDGRFVRNVN